MGWFVVEAERQVSGDGVPYGWPNNTRVSRGQLSHSIVPSTEYPIRTYNRAAGAQPLPAHVMDRTLLRSRNLLDVRLPASGIKKPNLESCAGLLRKRFNLASSLVIVVPAVARAVGTAGAKATASMTNATADIVAAISLNITIPRRGYYAFPVERS
jgi:hypothetical protein